MLNLFIDSPQHKHFLCGITHDNGYARILTQYSDKINRITLLEAGPSANEFRNLKFDKWSFPSVFRQHHFPRRYVEYGSQTAEPQATEAATSTGSENGSPLPTQLSNTQDSHTEVKNEIWLNENGARIDAPRTYSNKAKKTLDKRLKSRGITLCNAHYLGTCPNSQCALSHSEQLSRDELAVLRYRARILPCYDGLSCRSYDCFYGHTCPYDGNCTFGQKCKFFAYHGVDRVVKSKLQQQPTLVAEPSAPIVDT